MKKKAVKKLTVIIIAVVLLIAVGTAVIRLILFYPVGVSRTEGRVSLYNGKGYDELTVTDGEGLMTLDRMKQNACNKISPLNAAVREAERFQKDSRVYFVFCYDNGICQRIAVTGENVVIFNYCNADEYPEYYLDFNAYDYESSFISDGLSDYARQLFYEEGI